MGGNAAAIDRATGEVLRFGGKPAYATRLDMRKINRTVFKREMVSAFEALNGLYDRKFGEPIWAYKELPRLMSGEAFNGSSEHLFGGMSDKEFASHKPIVGDVDLTVPLNTLENIFDLLATLEGQALTPKVTYVGQNKSKQHGYQINSLFAYDAGDAGRPLVQVDFEGVDYEDGRPNEFAKFSHSSSWDDVTEGIKGVAHKYLLRSIAGSLSFRPDIVLLTPSSPLSPPEKVKVAKSSVNGSSLLSFSVDRGLRANAEQQFHPDGSPVMVGDKFAFKALPTNVSSYEKTRKGIFQTLFKEDPTPVDLKRLESFVGILLLLREYATPEMIESAYLDLVEDKLLGKDAQRLDATDPEVDRSTKMSIIARFKKDFPELSKHDDFIQSLENSYYESYKTRKVVESLIRSYVIEIMRD